MVRLFKDILDFFRIEEWKPHQNTWYAYKLQEGMGHRYVINHVYVYIKKQKHEGKFILRGDKCVIYLKGKEKISVPLEKCKFSKWSEHEDTREKLGQSGFHGWTNTYKVIIKD